jgi:hypothetical protein
MSIHISHMTDRVEDAQREAGIELPKRGLRINRHV